MVPKDLQHVILNYIMAVLLQLKFWKVPLYNIAEQTLQYTQGCPCKTLFLKVSKHNL